VLMTRCRDNLRILIEHGARPSLKTEHGWTPAHYAAEFGKLAVLQLLHSLHAPIDKQDCCGDKPVRIAEIYGHRDCVTFLQRLELNRGTSHRRLALHKSCVGLRKEAFFLTFLCCKGRAFTVFVLCRLPHWGLQDYYSNYENIQLK
uniref:Uncharacterized protein n=1 Tax=Takifugu rubripes TaxID=31033 RepID=A0A3B5K9F6_TAKRU